MKRSNIIIIVSVCAIILAAFIFVIYVGNSIKQSSPHLSETIAQSKEVKAFEAEYKPIFVSISLTDSLMKYRLSHVNLSSLEYWIEKMWGVDYKLIFFEKINYGNKSRLLITDPTSLQLQNQVHPFIGFKIKNTSDYTGNNGMGGKVCVINIDKVPLMINLEIYVTIDHSTTKYIGDITIKKEPL
jgi:hypothetical protein